VIRDEEWRHLSAYYESPFFFEAKALRENPPVVIELDKIYRQADDTFINLLNNLRHNILEEADIELLNTHHERDHDSEGSIFITTHNYKADQINQTRLAETEGKEFIYKAEIEGIYKNLKIKINYGNKFKRAGK